MVLLCMITKTLQKLMCQLVVPTSSACREQWVATPPPTQHLERRPLLQAVPVMQKMINIQQQAWCISCVVHFAPSHKLLASSACFCQHFPHCFAYAFCFFFSHFRIIKTMICCICRSFRLFPKSFAPRKICEASSALLFHFFAFFRVCVLFFFFAFFAL